MFTTKRSQAQFKYLPKNWHGLKEYCIAKRSREIQGCVLQLQSPDFDWTRQTHGGHGVYYGQQAQVNFISGDWECTEGP